MQEALRKFFNFEEYETNFKKEIIAGTTNFLTMAYILGVNTIILSSAGMDFNSVFLATAIYIYCCKIIWLFLSRSIGYGFCIRNIIFTSFSNWNKR